MFVGTLRVFKQFLSRKKNEKGFLNCYKLVLILFLLSIYLTNIKACQIEGQFTNTLLKFVSPTKFLHTFKNISDSILLLVK